MGIDLCVFKIGVTSHPVIRYVDYVKKNFTAMWVIFMGTCIKEVHMLEAALIASFRDATGCQNAPGSGGEGSLNRSKFSPPYFAYVSGGRADQHKRVG